MKCTCSESTSLEFLWPCKSDKKNISVTNDDKQMNVVRTLMNLTVKRFGAYQKIVF